ncbi:flagellin [Vibrio neptunius]|uniref:Flagellin n=1 Tax=Vibrio neptunius TaxID=170651 RepID=A0ABS3A7J0_9VIBR|nr:flagellin [Vibrio neptunius]MBN3495048.1 flagellin [Vibrio neptunius]MBN3517425.1 flagellin [Vibrio neptunius]MBN3551373.1 flagellin [Vibrio neptunius]MBN3579819.1 flagellin [Vibrio neptunius]MCH9873485.1 flagellin [Vibrio neptunius]
MVMSMVEVRPHNVKLTGHDRASISPPRSSETHGDIGQRKLAARNQTPASYSVSGVLLTQGQQNATSVQIATRSLQAIGVELAKIKQGLTRAMNLGANQVSGLQEGLAGSKANIERVIDNARFDGNKVIDNELKLKLEKADMRRFSIPGLNIHRLSDKAEQIRLDFPQGHSVMVQFDGQSEGKQTVKMLDRSLIPLGLRASLSEDGTILFESSEKAYQQMQQKVMVTGQGYRFPAGQSNVMTLKAEPEGIAELSFDLSSREGVKQTIAKVNKHFRQVQIGLEQANAIGSELTMQMQTLHKQSSVISANQVQDKLKLFDDNSGQFSTAFMALNAQANVKRHSVVALMRS